MNAAVTLQAVSAQHPFPGLRPFAYDDHAYFFGREDQTYALYRLIDRFRFVTVVGSSGSGKSSLVRAGLLPLIDAETQGAGGRNWVWKEMRPGDEPLQRLTRILASLSTDDDPMIASARHERIAAQLQRSSFGILDAVADANGVKGASILLVIDQFEELFRFATASSLGPNVDDAQARERATQFVQLLLEASRAQSSKIQIVLTMRSDFIGDCARFHGLPEAVCAAQFLVPSLTRDQLDEVIRKPIAQAGATIDPELVERLINDCGTEMDQLPVLQHCLSRLWEEAGKPAATIAAASGELNAVPPPRHLSLEHYRNIGGFADALSRHADEVLQDIPAPALQLAVEQVFRALSELDKEGRAIRRALQFQRLVAETGVSETTVRKVLDRFRAEDCSFLTPPISELKDLAPTTLIDVGHEALLRRWDKVSGEGSDPGWLRSEQQAGERYRGLLAIADGDDATLPSHQVEERLAWWKARPRTAAWAERYGGGFDRVQRLLMASQRRERLKRWTAMGVFVSVVGIAVLMGYLYFESKRAQLAAVENRRIALNAVKTSVSRLAGYLNDGTLRAAGAQKLLEDAQATLNRVGVEHSSPETSEIEIWLILAISDVKDAINDGDAALEFALKGQQLAQKFLETNPNDDQFRRLLYASRFRVGDRYARNIRDKVSAQRAEDEYRAAVELARGLVARHPENLMYQNDLVFVLNKVADIEKSRGHWQNALEMYQEGLQIAQKMTERYPTGVATQKNRIGQVYSERDQAGDRDIALANYREATAIMDAQLKRTPENASLISNIANNHRRIGQALKDKPEEAMTEFQAAMTGRQKLYEADPGNPMWRSSLITDYTLLADTLVQQQEWRAALQNYAAALRIVEGLAVRDPADTSLQRTLANLNFKRAEALVRRGNELLVKPEPVDDQAQRMIKEAIQRYQSAASEFETLAGSSTAAAQLGPLFEIRIKIGDVQIHQNKYKDALVAYDDAAKVMERAAPAKPDWRIKLSVALEQAADFLASDANADMTGYQPASDDGKDALLYYRKALAALDVGSSQDDNPDLKARRAVLTAKIETQKAIVR